MRTPDERLSLWSATTSDTAYPPLPGRTDLDVAVIGAGITGLSVALELVERGMRVAVIDAGRIASATTANTTAKVTALHGLMYAALARRSGREAAHTYASANTAAVERIASRVAELRIACAFGRTAAYTYATDPAFVDELRAEADLLADLGLPASFVTEATLPFGIAGAVRLDDQAQFHPRRYCLALADAIRSAGGEIYERTTATDIEDGISCLVTTDRGEITSTAVVVATQIPFLNQGLFFARAHPRRSYAIGCRIGGTPPDGMFLSIDQPTRSVRSFEDIDGTYLAIGGEGHRTGEQPHTDPYAELEQWARMHFDVRAVPYRWSAQDYIPADGVPYIGRSSNSAQNVYVATGFQKWGMTTGTLAGMIIADLIADRENAYAALFDATRLNLLASAPRLVSENATVARHLIGDLARPARTLDDLQPDDGALVQHDGQTIAAYREADGSVVAVSARCTHMGCKVAFNAQERSWDCPCHGSRFGLSGEVLQGPATEPLTPIEVQSRSR